MHLDQQLDGPEAHGAPGDPSSAGAPDAWLEAAREASAKRRHPKQIIDKKTGQFADSDEQLFARFQQGDQAAFLTIYERYKEPIYAYCARVLLSTGLSREQVEDTFQDVFLRLAQYQHTFTGGDFQPWIFTVTRHSCLSAKRKGVQQRNRTEYVGNAEDFEEEVSQEVRSAFSSTDDALERLSHQEQIELLLQAIARLPEEFREALVLSEYEGLTYDEIGKITGTSLSTIRIRIYRAKARLRKMLLPIIGDQVDDLLRPDAE